MKITFKERMTFGEWFDRDKCLESFIIWLRKHQIGDMDLDTYSQYQYFVYYFNEELKRHYREETCESGKKLTKVYPNEEDFRLTIFAQMSAEEDMDPEDFMLKGIA